MHTTFTAEQIARIDSAADLAQAYCFAGDTLSGSNGQEEYILAKRGRRALGGFFQPTRANIRAKFATVWTAEHTH